MSNLHAREVSADIGGTRYTITVGFNMQTALLAAISREGKDSRIAVVSDEWVGEEMGRCAH